MAAKVCQDCGISYPAEHAGVCDVRDCHAALVASVTTTPDLDWRERAEALNSLRDDEARVIAWRFQELERAGYDLENALVLAGRIDIDLHQATMLLQSGCRLKTALRILL